MIGFYIQQKDEFLDRARYTWRTLSRMMGVDSVDIESLDALNGISALVIYGDNIAASLPQEMPVILIARSDYRKSDSLTALDVRSIISMQHRHPKEIIALFESALAPLSKPLYCDEKSKTVMISRSSNRVHVAEDVPATCFYFLSMENERRTQERDLFNRFQRNFSPLGEKIYEHPVIDRYASLLKSLLQELIGSEPFKPIWPNEKKFAVALTHDVDRIRTWTFHKARRALKGQSNKNLFKRLTGLVRSIFFPENWLGNFNFITRLEQKFGASSTFFFVSKHRHRLDPTYKLSSQRLQQGLRIIKERGCDVGIHGTIPSAAGGGLLGVEKVSLQNFVGKDIVGGRQHYLCFSAETPVRWTEAGLKYDSTLGFSYDAGYRCGTSFPFFLCDGDKESPILELPLILMDTVMFLESKQHLSAEQAWHVIEKHLQETKNNSALLTINWHNSDLHPYDVYGYSQLYLRILQWAQEQGGWLASTDQIYEWWAAK